MNCNRICWLEFSRLFLLSVETSDFIRPYLANYTLTSALLTDIRSEIFEM